MNPYIIIGLLVAWALSLAGVGTWQNEAGHVAERVEWQGRENKELVDANTAIKALEEKYRKAEQDHAAALGAIATNYEGKIQDANNQHARDVAAVRSGTLRLRDPGASGKCPVGDPMPGIATSPGVGDGRAAGELSGQSSEFLLGEASRADSIAEQLAACQQVVRSDRAPQKI